MTIARVLPRTTAALDPGAIVASTAEATLRSLWAAPETKTAARGLVLAACAVAAAFPRPFATVASILIATAVVLHASNALARPSSLRRGALLLYAAAPLAEAGAVAAGGGAVRADGAAVLIAAIICGSAVLIGAEDLPAVAYAAWAFYGGAPRRGLLALGLAVFRWALSAPNAGGAVSRRAIHESRAAVRAAASRIAAAPLEDLSREQLFRAALLGRVAQVWDNDAATANDAWAVVLEAVAALGAGAAGAGVAALAALERRLVDERFDADETAEWASTRAWELADAAAPGYVPAVLCRGLGAAPGLLAFAWLCWTRELAVAAPLAPVVARDLMRLRLIRDECAERTRACEDAAADARAAARRAAKAGTAAAAREADQCRCALVLLDRDGGLDLIIGDEDAIAAWHNLRKLATYLDSRACRVSLRTLQTSARVRRLATGVARLSAAGAAAYAAGGDGGAASALSLTVALAGEARLLLGSGNAASRDVVYDAAAVFENSQKLWREYGCQDWVTEQATEHYDWWAWTAKCSGGAVAGAAVGGLLAGPVGAAAGAALAGGGVYGASVSEAEPAPPPLPVLPVPDETDRWSDVASSDEEGDVDSVHKSMLRC